METNFASNQFACVLSASPELQLFTLETLKLVIQSLLELNRPDEMTEVLRAVLAHCTTACARPP